MGKNLDVLIITQARMGSTRLPNKILLKVNGTELLRMHLNRLQKSRIKDELVVATTVNSIDDVVESNCKTWDFSVSRGSENDVLDRFYQCALLYKPNWIVRVTADCPLIDSDLIDSVVAFAKSTDVDYCSNTLVEHYPDGQDIEVFKFSALETAWKNADLKSDREHVTPYIRRNSDFNGGTIFTGLNFACPYNFSEIRMTVDEQKDLDLITILVDKLGTEENWLTYTKYIISNNLAVINKDIIRNEGFLKSLKNDKNG